MKAVGIVVLVLAVVGVGGAIAYSAAKTVRPPITQVVQAPSAAVAGINVLGALASKGIDAWIASKAQDND